jgi:hypothetical protein
MGATFTIVMGATFRMLHCEGVISGTPLTGYRTRPSRHASSSWS